MVASNDIAANKRLLLDFIHMLNVQRKIDEAIDRYFKPNFIEHDPASGSGASAMKAFFKQFFIDYPAATLSVKRMIAEGDLIAMHFHGKLKPEERGVAGMEIFRIEDGKLAEHWQVMQDVPATSLNNNGMV